MDEQSASSGAPKQTKLIAALAVGFGLFHCASLLIAMLPDDWMINRMLAPYRQLTGTEQEWIMFSSIPVAQDKEITVEVRDAAGNVTSVGPILPGLTEFDMDSQLRYYPLLLRLTSRDGIYFDRYLEKLHSAVVESGGAEVSEFSVRSETELIRPLKNIQEDGNMTVRGVEVVGPIRVGEK